MFFGMSNSPATFSRMMTTIFREMLQEGSLVNYMDDFAIPGETKHQLQERTVKFLKIADRHNLYFKQSKCDFDATEISLLGTVIGNGKATMEKEKVEAVQNWTTPTTIKDVEKFLGFANFYRRFIKNFSMIAAPLNVLKGGKVEKVWKWESEEQNAFDAIKKVITSEPVLTLPNKEGKFRVEVDASNVGTGAVLPQEQQGKWHPVAFMSKSLLDAEKNYEIYDKELLAIVKALRVGDSGITSETHTSGCFKHTRRVVCIVPIWHPYRASQYCLCLECLWIVLYMVPQCIECIEYCYTLLVDDYIVLSYSGAPNS
jgi:hypothetical protein